MKNLKKLFARREYQKWINDFRTLVSKKEARRNSWHSFVQTFNNSTPIPEIWSKARALKYRLANHIKYNLSQEQFDSFLSTINSDYVASHIEVSHHEPIPCSDYWLEQPFSLEELKFLTLLQRKHHSRYWLYFLRYSQTSFYFLTHGLMQNNQCSSVTINHPRNLVSFFNRPHSQKRLLRTFELRPIALATCVRKLVVSMLNRRLIHWLEINSMLPYNMFRFRSGKSTIDAITHLTTALIKPS